MVGTHAPKLASSRNKTSALLLKTGTNNRPGMLAGSGNGAKARYMKILLRPIAILGEDGSASLFDRISSGDESLLSSFENVFGAASLMSLKKGMTDRLLQPVVKLTGENYPVFFIPDADGTDLQASPGGSIEAHSNMKTLKISMAQQAKKDRQEKMAATYGEWSVLTFADKAQNVIVGAPIDRTRFRSLFPQKLNQIEADIWKWKKTGKFPRMSDVEASASLVDFALDQQRFQERETYRGGDIKERLVNNRAKFCILRAKYFIADIQQMMISNDVDQKDIPEPDLKSILSQLNIRSAIHNNPKARGKDVAFVIASMNSDDFNYALKKNG
jgi:hypothetical protein